MRMSITRSRRRRAWSARSAGSAAARSSLRPRRRPALRASRGNPARSGQRLPAGIPAPPPNSPLPGTDRSRSSVLLRTTRVCPARSLNTTLLDNTSPTGFFAPRNPNNPTQAKVDVADSLSGVAGGQIQIQTATGWRALASSYNASTGQLIAAIPDDGRLPDGNYQLRAVVSDAVGNSATVTSDLNGTPEIITEPLRIVTRLPVGRSHALIKRCTLVRIRIPRRRMRHQRPAARFVRRCSQVVVPRKGGALKLRLNQHARVTGLLQTVDGEPVPGVQVRVASQATGWRRHRGATVITNSRGRFTYTIGGGPSRTISFS